MTMKGNAWLPANIALSGSVVTLKTLTPETLIELNQCAANPKIWKHYAYDGSNSQRFNELYAQAFEEHRNGTQHPFAIYHNATGSIIGSTRLMDIQPRHRKLEIGFTWLSPDYWGTGVNLECKYLLLTYCFEELKALRVQLKTDVNNIRSQKAIEKIGGCFEGVMRNDMVRDDGTCRDSAYFSFIAAEWNKKKQQLAKLLVK